MQVNSMFANSVCAVCFISTVTELELHGAYFDYIITDVDIIHSSYFTVCCNLLHRPALLSVQTRHLQDVH